MEFYIYNQKGEYTGIIDDYNSIQWTKKYNETGTFEIYVADTIENNNKFSIGNRIIKSDDGDIGFITYSYSHNEQLEVRGYLDNLNDRIVRKTEKIRNVEKDLYTLINNNKRNLDIQTDVLKNLEEKVETDITWDTLREAVSDVCKKVGLGYRMIAKEDILNVFEIYKRGTNDDVQFSEDIGNIIAQSYEQDKSEFKNYAIVAGEGEGTARTIVEVDQTEGGERFELYVDAKDLSRTYTDADEEEQEYTDAEYIEQLKQRGISKLKEQAYKKTFTCEIDLTNESFIYGVDYFLGDIVPVKSKKYSFSKKFRLINVNEIKEDAYQIVGVLEEV